jgi:uncharacterized protein (DUF433 family)
MAHCCLASPLTLWSATVSPAFGGLRYPVETLLELLSSGMSETEILADYEDLELEDLRAAVAYGGLLVRA